jgi:zinc transport system ATP-binding protein
MKMKKANNTVLEVKNLEVDRMNTSVIRNANFTVDKSDFVGIVGPNGGGKTTLLHTVLGILPRKSGTIRLFGKDIKKFSEWDKIAYVSQDAINFDNQFPLTVKELVGLGRVNRHTMGRKLKKQDWEAVDDALGFLGILDISNRRIGQLSGGQKQRVFVAKALVRNPEILFLDEPVAGIDAMAQEAFYKKLSDLNGKKGITILIVSHDLTAVFCRMSKIICVNRDVNASDLTEDVEPNEVLRGTYGDHFRFVMHDHACEGVFDNG